MGTLFRQEVIDAKRRQWLGEILIARPLSLTFYTGASLLIIAAICAFLIWGDYTRRERVSGKILLTQGVAKIYSPVVGTVVKKLVSDGAPVRKGQVLYIVSAERMTAKGNTDSAIGEQIQLKRGYLKNELELRKRMSEEDIAALQRKIEDLGSQLSKVEQETAIQQRRLALSDASLERFRSLLQSQFVSPAQMAEREQDRLDQEARLESLQRTALSIKTELTSTRSALRNAPLNARSQLSSIERGISDAEQESYENEAKREIAITALQDGRATAVLLEVGQTVTPTTTMLSILPPDANFEAVLYVPTRSIGFMREGATVQMRYEAFPYQKFGQYTGHIKTISLATLAPAELQVLNVPVENLYRVTVALDAQHVVAYGKNVSLQDGMQLEADVLLDTRKLYEWLLEPLYSISGKM